MSGRALTREEVESGGTGPDVRGVLADHYVLALSLIAPQGAASSKPAR